MMMMMMVIFIIAIIKIPWKGWSLMLGYKSTTDERTVVVATYGVLFIYRKERLAR